MSDLRAAMNEFSFLEERRKAGLLSAADERRWNELRQGLGQPEPAPATEAATSEYSAGYYAADGQWYSYDPQQWAEQYPGWTWDPVQQQWIPQAGWDPQDPNADAASGHQDVAGQPETSFVDGAPEPDADVLEVSSDEITLIDDDEVPSAVAAADEDEGPTLVDPDDILPVADDAAPEAAHIAYEQGAVAPASDTQSQPDAAGDVEEESGPLAAVHDSFASALSAGIESVAARAFHPSAVFADLVPEPEPAAARAASEEELHPSALFGDLPEDPEPPPAPAAAAPEPLDPGPLFGDVAEPEPAAEPVATAAEESSPSLRLGDVEAGAHSEDGGHSIPILEALPEEEVIEPSPDEDPARHPMEQVVSDDELLAEAALPKPPAIDPGAELTGTVEPERWVVRESIGPSAPAAPEKEILAVDLEVEAREDEIELTDEVAEEEESPEPSPELFAEPSPALFAGPSRIAGSPLPSLQPSWISGEHRVVVQTAVGQTRRGIIRDADLLDDWISIDEPSGRGPQRIATDSLKAIFFMLPSGSESPPLSGTKLRITFKDGRQLSGFTHDYSPQDPGFFVVPAQNGRHTARVFVYRSGVKSVVED